MTRSVSFACIQQMYAMAVHALDTLAQLIWALISHEIVASRQRCALLKEELES
ncbi:MAG TPA: hypothetical protein VN729_04010 [Ktedonobacteraceae bacterium]|nr:hypothetical protein [Ktedonobacteraceae bacterium]